MTTKPTDSLQAYWRSIQSTKPRLKVHGSELSNREFPPGADELVIDGTASRRKFMGILGASTALAGMTTGCVRKPKEKIMPFADRPEDLIPGNAMHYATAMQVGATVMGLVVESQDGRPIKVEGNKRHPGSQGATDVFAQASILGLYDPERSRTPKSRTVHARGQGASEDEAKKSAVEALCELVHSRTLESSKSIDRAVAAREACLERVQTPDGKIHVEKKSGFAKALAALELDEQGDVEWELAWQRLDALAEDLRSSKGKGLALVIDGTRSPSLRGKLQEFKKAYPEAKIIFDDPTYPTNTFGAAELLAGPGAVMYQDLNNAKLILAVDSDFLHLEHDSVRLAREYSQHRKADEAKDLDLMSRLYSVEPHMTNTGAQADHRLRVKGADIASFMKRLVRVLADDYKLVAPESKALGPIFESIKAEELDEASEKFISALAKDMVERGRQDVAVVVGERQPPAVHVLGFLANVLLKSKARGSQTGSYVFRNDSLHLPTEGLDALASGLDKGEIETVICLGTNPAYDAPGALGMKDKLAKAKLLIHAGHYCDETGQSAHWHIPLSHYLEAWGDLETVSGAVSIQQPLIAPLHDTPSALEFLGRFVAPGEMHSGMKLIRSFWESSLDRKIDEKRWRRWLHDGVVAGLSRGGQARFRGWNVAVDAIKALPETQKDDWEVNFHLDPTALDGRFTNNAWMQECPHPMSKLTWDNAAYISQKEADELGVKNGDNLSIQVDGRAVSVPVWIAPGQAPRTVSLNFGYGRDALGTVASGSGFDVRPLQASESGYFVKAEKVTKGSGHYQLVSTQDHGSLDPDGEAGMPLGFNYDERPLYRETTVAGFRKDQDFAQKGDLMPKDRLKSLWTHPELEGKQQWGMVIDLNQCTGCSACVVACQAENNIPVVGKEQVANGREMHWIRLDRYYRGDADDPQAVIQPVGCMHCETAPCENVCPVQATAHSPEGLNDMAYNRCVGTRYCANNCPYKVRRFNFFNFNLDKDPLEQMAMNPDVTVRFRGVIEKCSYCVQRIQEARIEAKTAGEELIADGKVVAACEQVCPSQAITFGDIKDPKSRVAKAKQSKRNYSLLADLNTQPRTTYLGRVRNPNPELG